MAEQKAEKKDAGGLNYPDDANKAVKILWDSGFTYEMIYTATGIRVRDIQTILGKED